MLRSWRETAALLALAAGATIALTYPLAFKIGTLGRIDTTDGSFSIWNVAWVAHSFLVDPTNLYNANIFYPHRTTLAFSEPNIGAGMLAVPVYWATNNPYAAHNSVVLAGFVLAVLGGYYLTRYLTGSRIASALAGLLFAFCPYMFAKTAHIQLMLTAGLPWTLLAFHRLVDRPDIKRAGALALALDAQGLSCGYYGVFSALMVGFGAIYYAGTRRLWRSWQYWSALIVAVVLAVVVVLPFVLPILQLAAMDAFSGRTLAAAREWSANWPSYLASSAISHRWLLPLIGTWNDVLFPGFVSLALGIAGGWMGLRVQRLREAVGFYALLGVLAFWASFGPDAGLYTLFNRTVPFFPLLRAPGRFGIVVALSLAVLSGCAVSEFVRRHRRATPLAFALLPVALLELATITPWVPQTEPPADAYRMLAGLPRGGVAEFPFFWLREDFHRHAYYMLNSTIHWQPLINGYSDHFPDDFREMAVPVSSFPARSPFRFLREHEARYVVFHLDLYDTRSREKLMERLKLYEAFLRPLWTKGEVWLFEIVAWPELPSD